MKIERVWQGNDLGGRDMTGLMPISILYDVC